MPTTVLRMLYDPGSGVTPHAADRAYMSGMDQIPWPCRNRLEGDELIVERGVSESGRLQIPLIVPGHGELMLSTATLMQRDRPYRLEIELARGKLNQVRNQLADWQALGLVISSQVQSLVQQAALTFSQAATAQEDPRRAAEIARLAIRHAVEAGEALVDCYCAQALAMRHRSAPQLPTRLAVRVSPQSTTAATAKQLSGPFNSFMVPLLWRDIEATEGNFQWEPFDQLIEQCRQQGTDVMAGPLLLLDDRGLPDWLALWEGDFEGLLSFASDYVAQCVQRYRGKVQLWQCAARINVTDVLGLQDDQKMQLVVRVLEVARLLDPDTPAIIRFDQPWGEYLRRNDRALSPIHFADALVRSGLQLSGIGLEINVGYFPCGSMPRDRLDFSRLLDLWSYLGLPLHLTLTVPSDDRPDPKARSCSTPVPDVSGWSAAMQAQWLDRYLPLMLAKSFVHSITWNQLSDAEPHELAHGGLFDAAGVAKPALQTIHTQRKLHLA